MHGWLGEYSLRTFINEHRDAFSSVPFVWICSVDSSPVPAMPWVRRRISLQKNWAISEDPLIISGADLVGLSNEVFTGFDEIWLMSTVTRFSPEQAVPLQSSRRFGDEPPPGLTEWMTVSSFEAGFGDGDGLNYVVKVGPLAIALGFAT